MSAIDEATLQEIRELDEETYIEVIKAYLEDLAPSLNEIATAISGDDADTLGKVAHRLKGSSATMGLNGMAAACLELENLAEAAARLALLIFYQLHKALARKSPPTSTAFLAK